MKNFFSIQTFVLILFILLGVFLVLYLSWVSSPKLEYNQFIPKILANWADKHENDNIRTAIPLFILGLLTGVVLMSKMMEFRRWLLSWCLLVLLVFIAEVGQLVLPLRSFDWKDVFWGLIGSGVALLLLYFIKFGLSKNKNFKC